MTDLILPTLADLEAKISQSFWDQCAALYDIERRQLYHPQFDLFSDYLRARWSHIYASEVTWRQHRASYEAYLQANDVGVILHNEYAARALREVDRRAHQLVSVLAREYSVTDEIKASDIVRAAEVVSEALETAAVTGGLVDTGDGGMTALGAAVELEMQERILQQRERIGESMRRAGWSAPMVIKRFGHAQFAIPAEWFGVPPGDRIEIRWRIVELEKAT